MYMRFVVSFLLSLVGLVTSQSYSFGIGVDHPSPSASFPFTFQTSSFTPSNTRTSSRGASRTASGSASGHTRLQTEQNEPSSGPSQSISSFSFSGIEESVPTSTAQRRPQQQQHSLPQQTQSQSTPQHTQQQQIRQQPQSLQDQQQIRQQPTSRNVRGKWQRPAAEENEINEITIGKSPCARGTVGHDCRLHLMKTAMSCTSGKCHECQQCGSVSARDWITCCRDHFLCCRPLARSCQRCDQPTLEPFCDIAFGKCK